MDSLKSSVQDFLSHCKYEKNLSEKTIKAYTTDLNQVLCFSNFSQTRIDLITKHEIREFLTAISTFKPRTIKRKMATLKALFNFLEFEDKIIINPFRKMKIKIKEPKILPVVMNIKEMTQIFKMVYKHKSDLLAIKNYSYSEAIRNIVIIELLFATGARVSEIANLKLENINLETGSIKITGKGDKERIIQVCNKETILVLKEYHKLFKKKINVEGYFLINRLNKKLSDQSIRNLVRQLTNESGIQKHITPHIFRHSFATLLLEKDVDIKYIQSMLGHSSISTTQIYTHVNKEKQRQILQTKHPRKDFTMI